MHDHTQKHQSVFGGALGTAGKHSRIVPSSGTDTVDEGPPLAPRASGVLSRAGLQTGGDNGAETTEPAETMGRGLTRRQQTTTRLHRFVKRHGSDMARRIQRETIEHRDQIKADQVRARWVLLPDKNRFLGRWDMLMSLALIYTATLTPFETSFIPPVIGPAAWMDAWFLANRCLDGVFLVDMGLQFFVAYQTGNAFGEGTWVQKHEEIIWHYLTTWFCLDLGTVVLPMAFDIWTASSAFDEQALIEAPNTVTNTVNGAEKVGVLRVLRALRFVKLVRLVRASRLYARWRARITLSSATMTYAGCAFTLIFSSHLFACLIALQATLHGNPEDTWLGERAYGMCDGLQPVGSAVAAGNGHGRSASIIPGCESLGLGSWYLASFSWATMVITGTGATRHRPAR
jgi:hypothetical protein